MTPLVNPRPEALRLGLVVWIGSGVSIYLLKTDTNSS